MSIHGVDRKRWQQLSLLEQMGNIGSEVGRSLRAKRQNDDQAAEMAFSRTLDLIEASIKSFKTYPKLKELMRAKREYMHAYFEDRDPEGIENYFMQFAIAARLQR